MGEVIRGVNPPGSTSSVVGFLQDPVRGQVPHPAAGQLDTLEQIWSLAPCWETIEGKAVGPDVLYAWSVGKH